MQIIVENDQIIIELVGSEKICSCRRRLKIQIKHIISVKIGLPEARLEMPMLATSIPGVIKAGTYLTRNGKEFWFVKPDKKQYLTIELHQEAPFRRLVLGLDEGEDAFLQQLGFKISVPVEVDK
ncbi:hypothetical protein KKF05_03115 [Patescibacteria group bacterium]|nr:hypothetical protein [Patescibacteria group bacterium]MBU1029395.1 hypothetical protein [Patescibacteria group bacterium]MBU1915733.1 hypothetical protein [Patescibacteria group bacterium]